MWPIELQRLYQKLTGVQYNLDYIADRKSQLAEKLHGGAHCCYACAQIQKDIDRLTQEEKEVRLRLENAEYTLGVKPTVTGWTEEPRSIKDLVYWPSSTDEVVSKDVFAEAFKETDLNKEFRIESLKADLEKLKLQLAAAEEVIAQEKKNRGYFADKVSELVGKLNEKDKAESAAIDRYQRLNEEFNEVRYNIIMRKESNLIKHTNESKNLNMIKRHQKGESKSSLPL